MHNKIKSLFQNIKEYRDYLILINIYLLFGLKDGFYLCLNTVFHYKFYNTLRVAGTDKRIKAVATLSAFNTGIVRKNGFLDSQSK